MRIELDDDEQPEINLIALIDCIFFLLMFFMVATSFRHQEDGRPPEALPIELPRSAVSFDQATAAADPLVIGVDVKGGVYWGRARLHAEAARDPSRPVRIDGDTQVAYQEVVHLLDLCQFEGLTHVAMRTRAGR
jgi:biopolymer transport protein ExbD